MRTLQQFPNTGQQVIFPEAVRLPGFFENNLIDPARVVKAFYNDPQANIRVFYYQYLKLCFQLESMDYEGYIGKIEQVINNEDFKFVFYEDDDPAVFSDLQFKQFITQFFSILGEGGTVEDNLNHYPIMDTVLIYFFRAILILTGKADSLDCYLEREDLLNFLCNYFGVEISTHNKCIKFVETDIFIYEEDPKEVFMAYMDYDKTPQEEQNESNLQASYQSPAPEEIPPQIISSYETTGQFQEIGQFQASSPPIVPPPPPSHPLPHAPATNSSRRGTSEINQSYISSEFLDYTSSANLAGIVHSNKLKESATMQRPPPATNNIYNSTKIEPSQVEYSPAPVAQLLKPVEPKPEYTSNYTNNLSYSSQSNTQSFNLGSFDKQAPQNTTGLSNVASQNSFSSSPLVIKTDQVQDDGLFKWEPTKESFKMSTQHYPSIPEYQKPPSMLKQHPPQQQTYQPLATGDTFRTKQSSYTSAASEPYKYSDGKSQFEKDPVPVYQAPPSNHQAPYPMTNGPAGMTKSAFNLNVSVEFTNSITMKAMAEPFKTSVRGIRQRARNFRDSLSKFIK